jgi:hypothetical protein
MAQPREWTLGDPSKYDSVHAIQVEDQNAIGAFVPTSAKKYQTVTLSATVSDGRLTISPAGGANTKLDYVTIASLTGADNRPGLSRCGPSSSQILEVRAQAAGPTLRIHDSLTASIAFRVGADRSKRRSGGLNRKSVLGRADSSTPGAAEPGCRRWRTPISAMSS